MRKWQPYLLARRLIVRTDQKSLKFFMEQHVIAGEYQCWIAKLVGYDFGNEYKKGLENSAVDALY